MQDEFLGFESFVGPRIKLFFSFVFLATDRLVDDFYTLFSLV